MQVLEVTFLEKRTNRVIIMYDTNIKDLGQGKSTIRSNHIIPFPYVAVAEQAKERGKKCSVWLRNAAVQWSANTNC